MEVNKLMIGDWVIPCIWDADSTPSKIVGIYYNSYRGKDYVDWVDCEVWEELDMNDIKPIPLSEEILEKNGFRYDDSPFVQGWCGYGLLIYNGRVTVGQNVSMECQYAHHLQHILRLCGLNEMADNFKI